ncbi:hypothetical protein AWZ03_002236 [Drosophila navojoa]|uniref:Uncharacterized protein n=1 Tax=Drosophila navojoa TaxID=7232 RepID=A0A484BUK6_DRONA|nr:hypothetical protein AWZ03_002236 [Drosophila navojoa]
MRVIHLYLIVLSALLAVGVAAPAAEMKQLLLADVNQAADQQEMPALRLARQLGNIGRFGRFDGARFAGGGGRRFGGGRLPFGYGRRRVAFGRRRLANPDFFYPQPFGFFG